MNATINIILKRLDIGFSPEGDILRDKKKLSTYARNQFAKNGFHINGESSANLPGIIGEDLNQGNCSHI